MSQDKYGGKSPIGILLQDSSDILAALLGSPQPLNIKEYRINKLVSQIENGKYEFTIDVRNIKYIRTILGNGSHDFDIVVLSILPGLISMKETGKFDNISDDYHDIIMKGKQCNSHILIFNVSSIFPGDLIHNYHVSQNHFSLFTAKNILAIFHLSLLEGISVIDVDRLVAELGADNHVTGFGTYSATAYNAIGEEFISVMNDISFFENRPLMKQLGTRQTQ